MTATETAACTGDDGDLAFEAERHENLLQFGARGPIGTNTGPARRCLDMQQDRACRRAADCTRPPNLNRGVSLPLVQVRPLLALASSVNLKMGSTPYSGWREGFDVNVQGR